MLSGDQLKPRHEVKDQELDRPSNEPEVSIPQARRARLKASIWDIWDKSPRERKLVQVDWWLLSYACTAYFIKSLDQSNTSNAYVSGMKEALDLKGNDLNYLTTYWNIGYLIGQLPSQLVLTKIRPSIWLPALELLWRIFVMALASAKNVETLFALRFLIGLCEASAYPGIITLLGNWYTPQELAKRSAIFQASSSASNMFSGYLQAALYSEYPLLYTAFGLFLILRMTRKPDGLANVIRSWPVWLIPTVFIAHVCGLRIYSYFNVWLKSTGRYTVEQVNVIPSAGYGLQIIFTLLYA
ncbi:hypothetical protein DTO013E5_1328 [Penicillium roqueforti]|nr:hypothetical protein DTO012A1_87 [Penicillium roqueforti]KAI2750978.1 hypothetical protein DTO013F2_4229 [Penicillium roqueforti]KAI2775040.1 hypothetical protein DTO012A8_525 [Penicillium roqueforti]KAI3083672.1 hypothetical protein CBS147339_2048 [Penicillium roqueforti]KAI3096697.1 hypothetical protein CBS147338_5112 [Penicillium roqueforti]